MPRRSDAEGGYCSGTHRAHGNRQGETPFSFKRWQADSTPERANRVHWRHPRGQTGIRSPGHLTRVFPPSRTKACAFCTLHAGETPRAMPHRSVEEILFVLQGRGQPWRKRGAAKQVVNLVPGSCAAILTGVHGQFRNSGREPPGAHPVHDGAVARRLGGGAYRGPLAGAMIRCWWSTLPAWLPVGTRA